MTDETEYDRTEQPTLYKLKKAREKGSVARGLDLGFLSALATFAVYLWFQGDQLAGRVAQTSRESLVAAPQLSSGSWAIETVAAREAFSLVRPLAFLVFSIFAAVLVMEVIQTGVVFSAEPLKPNLSRLNPAAGIKRLWTARLLIEAAKNILKLVVYAAIGAFLIRYALADLVGAIVNATDLAHAMKSLGQRLLVIILVAAALIAGIDQFLSRRDFQKRMRMSRRELKREHRDREGDPRLKQRRRQIHAQFAKLSQSLKGVRGADVLVTNPVHYAVALRYDPKTMPAPRIVAQGAHRIASRLKRVAFLYGVVVVENAPLARALYRLPLNSGVPEALYKPVADIYLGVRERRKRNAENQSHVS